MTVWLDEVELSLGDSLRRKIDVGLARSRYGIVVLSEAFFAKEWPNKELDALVAREDGRDKVILPVWRGVGATDILRHSPLLAGKLGVSTSQGLDHVIDKLVAAIRGTGGIDDLIEAQRRADQLELSRIRQDMIRDPSGRVLMRAKYAIDAILERRPRDIEALELRDSITGALEQLRPRPSVAAPAPAKPTAASSNAGRRWGAVGAALAFCFAGAVGLSVWFQGPQVKVPTGSVTSVPEQAELERAKRAAQQAELERAQRAAQQAERERAEPKRPSLAEGGRSPPLPFERCRVEQGADRTRCMLRLCEGARSDADRAVCARLYRDLSLGGTGSPAHPKP